METTGGECKRRPTLKECAGCMRTILPKSLGKGMKKTKNKHLNIVEKERCNNATQNLANKKGEIFFLLPKNHRMFTSPILAPLASSAI